MQGSFYFSNIKVLNFLPFLFFSDKVSLWPWIPDSSPSISQMLGFQACTATPGFMSPHQLLLSLVLVLQTSNCLYLCFFFFFFYKPDQAQPGQFSKIEVPPCCPSEPGRTSWWNSRKCSEVCKFLSLSFFNLWICDFFVDNSRHLSASGKLLFKQTCRAGGKVSFSFWHLNLYFKVSKKMKDLIDSLREGQ